MNKNTNTLSSDFLFSFFCDEKNNNLQYMNSFKKKT